MKIFKESRYQATVTGLERISVALALKDVKDVPSIFRIVFSELLR